MPHTIYREADDRDPKDAVRLARERFSTSANNNSWDFFAVDDDGLELSLTGKHGPAESVYFAHAETGTPEGTAAIEAILGQLGYDLKKFRLDLARSETHGGRFVVGWFHPAPE